MILVNYDTRQANVFLVIGIYNGSQHATGPWLRLNVQL